MEDLVSMLALQLYMLFWFLIGSFSVLMVVALYKIWFTDELEDHYREAQEAQDKAYKRSSELFLKSLRK